VRKKLFVFDLDFTLWNAGGTWCDCTDPPFTRKNGYVADNKGRKIVLYNDTLNIIKDLKFKEILIATASRTEAPAYAFKILELFNIRHLFDFEEIFPDRKINHFMNLKLKSGFEYHEMVFFDDEQRNIEDVSELGVTCELLQNGITLKHVLKYL
jgi:magnesium-dependent phosphatase 1